MSSVNVFLLQNIFQRCFFCNKFQFIQHVPLYILTGATVDFLVENGEKIHRIDRKFIAQTGDEVAMEAYYKDIDIRNSATNVTWYKQNEKIKFGGRFKLSNNNTVLTIKNLYLEDKGSYESVIMATNSSTFATEFKLIIHNGKCNQT